MTEENKTVSTKSADKFLVCLNWAHDLKYYLSKGRAVTLNGSAHKVAEKGKGALPVGEFGMTWVSATDWDELNKMYGKTERFKNGLIFKATDRASADDEAEDLSEKRHGLEPIDTKTTKTKKADD